MGTRRFCDGFSQANDDADALSVRPRSIGREPPQEADDVLLIGISIPRRAISTMRNVRRVT